MNNIGRQKKFIEYLSAFVTPERVKRFEQV